MTVSVFDPDGELDDLGASEMLPHVFVLLYNEVSQQTHSLMNPPTQMLRGATSSQEISPLSITTTPSPGSFSCSVPLHSSLCCLSKFILYSFIIVYFASFRTTFDDVKRIVLMSSSSPPAAEHWTSSCSCSPCLVCLAAKTAELLLALTEEESCNTFAVGIFPTP